jgi:hypothetical protein
MAHVVEPLSTKCKALSWSPSTTTKKKKSPKTEIFDLHYCFQFLFIRIKMPHWKRQQLVHQLEFAYSGSRNCLPFPLQGQFYIVGTQNGAEQRLIVGSPTACIVWQLFGCLAYHSLS